MTAKGTDARPKGLVAIEAEMDRQVGDAIASIAANTQAAAEIAGSLRTTGRLLMLGMGASHAVGRMVEPIYRANGIDALAIPLSEQLSAPVPTGGRTVFLTSQSGESAEIVRWLSETGGRTGAYGLTMDAGSTLGRGLPCLVGAGGAEKAFAATRSITVSLALHLAVLTALGVETDSAVAALRSATRVELATAVDALDGVRAVATSGRRLQGLAEAIALGIMELARIPAFALENGQLRHGPPEMFTPQVGLVFFRGSGAEAGIGPTVDLAVKAGTPVVVFDGSGEEAIGGAHTVAIGRAAGMAAIFSALLPAQRFMLAFASRRVEDVGTPRRSTKITRSE